MFEGIYARGGAARSVTSEAWLQAMLDVEAELARAGATAGEVPTSAAQAIAAACHAERFDAAQIARDGALSATPVVPLVAALRAAVGPQAAPHVHAGATSQDIIDTAAMLVAQRALVPLLADARGAADAAAVLADRHRNTPMAGRTLLRQARPTSFGLRAAGWLVGIDEARGALADVRDRRLAVQMGGPVGHRDPAIAARMAISLGLAEPTLPWHTIRVRSGALAGALGVLSGVLSKVARDVTLLAQDELGELSEGGSDRGGSSAMAHKRNPAGSVAVLACTNRVPGVVATMLSSMTQEHERAAGAWQAEWGTLSDLLSLTGSAAAWTRDVLEHLEVHGTRMRENLRALADAGVVEAQDPEHHLGAAGVLIDRALAAHR